ncbi:vascular endothelial growth factor A-A isoform X1 [Mastacembelus armatus]|uniref:vascular endothelial growth factor A-A isoform X1 n=1 Tax=Mastacembelus armatus TaxID=205130 RepID=UPI000E454F5D|nr:vascular endothelial growth factor A-A-like isoform X1 [Mastacembelus armatus]
MKLGFVIEAAVALYLLLSPAQSLPLSSINSTTNVLMFQEVWGRSFCRTIEKLVEVVQEYPAEVEHIFSPSCVPLVRCAGCCGDEKLECHPTRTTNVTMQLLKIRPSLPGQEYVEMTFVEHQTCEYFGNLLQGVKGKSKDQEEGNERRDKKLKNVKGDGTVLRKGLHKPYNYQLTADALFFLVLVGARSLAGNCSGPNPSVAVWLIIYYQLSDSFKSLPLICQYCVYRLKTAGLFY